MPASSGWPGHAPAARPGHDGSVVFRFASNMLALWGLCAKPACRRARRCRGDAQDCIARYARLAPVDAREGVKAMIEGLADGVSFDTAQDGAYDEVAAMIAWRTRVEEANPPRTGAA